MVGASAAALTSKPSSSTVRPSAFSPSTRTMRTAVGAIDTPSTVSTSPPKLLAPWPGASKLAATPGHAWGLPGFPHALAGATRIDYPVFVSTTLPTGGLSGYQLTAELPAVVSGRGRRGPNRRHRGPSPRRRDPTGRDQGAAARAAGRTAAARAREELAQ